MHSCQSLALTTAPTAASGLSVASTATTGTGQAPLITAESSSLPKRSRKDSSEKRKAGEWYPGAIAHYRPLSEKNDVSANHSKEVSASTAYANNLNKGRTPTITHTLKKAASTQSMDFDSVFEKLVANAEDFLDR